MIKLSFTILFSTLLISSCTKVGTYYAGYKKYLGLDKNDKYLFSRVNPTFKNEDIKVEMQNFDKVAESNIEKENVKENVKEEAVREAKAVEEKPVDSEFGRSIALFNSDRGKFKGEEDIERAPASVGTYYDNPYLKAQALIKKGNFQEADNYLNIYLKDNSVDAEHTYSCYFWLAELSLVKKDYVSAIANYYEIIDRKFTNTNYELIYFKLYESYTNMGRKELAKRYFTKIKEVNPLSTYIKVIK